jgi:two-component system, LytTR family, response regulator
MTPLRAVIVDDEAPARERLAALLSAHGEIEIVGEAPDVEPAVKLCARVEPDIVFLDVQLRTGTGFDVLARLEGSPIVVVISAFAEHAAKAASLHTFDFLLKPVHPQQLARTIERAIHRT